MSMKYLKYFIVSLLILGCSNDEVEELTIVESNYGNVSVQSGSYEEGTEITLTATPNEGNQFVTWYGIESNDSIITIEMNSNLKIKPIFSDEIIGFYRCDDLSSVKYQEARIWKEDGKLWWELLKGIYTEIKIKDGGFFAIPVPDAGGFGIEEHEIEILFDENFEIIAHTSLWNSYEGRLLYERVHFEPNSFENPFYRGEWETNQKYLELLESDNPQDYIDFFIKDAEQYGWDFGEQEIEIVLGNDTGAGSICDNTKVTLLLLEKGWYGTDPNYKKWPFESRIKVIYHELGHDLLNLNHICENGHIMTDYGICSIIWENEGMDTGDEYYNLVGQGEEFASAMGDLGIDNPNPLFNWERAVEDMFTLNKQSRVCD